MMGFYGRFAAYGRGTCRDTACKHASKSHDATSCALHKGRDAVGGNNADAENIAPDTSISSPVASPYVVATTLTADIALIHSAGVMNRSPHAGREGAGKIMECSRDRSVSLARSADLIHIQRSIAIFFDDIAEFNCNNHRPPARFEVPTDPP